MATTYNVVDKIPVGPASITFDGSDVPLFFDNVVLKIEEILKEIKAPGSFGENLLGKYVVGYKVTVTSSFMNENHDTLKLAMGLTELTSGPDKNLVDSKLGTQKVGKQLIIHPIDAGADVSRDITIYRAILSGNLERTYGFEQGKVPVTFEALVKDGADATSYNNMFCIGKNTISIAQPSISSVSTIAVGANGGSIVLTLANDTFASVIGKPSFTVSVGNTGLTFATLTLTDSTHVTLGFTGTAAAGTIAITANASALSNGVLASNTIAIVIAP